MEFLLLPISESEFTGRVPVVPFQLLGGLLDYLQPDGPVVDGTVLAVRPYFDEAIGLLAGARDRLDGLTEFLLAQPPGLGPRSLKRFFAGNRRNCLAEWIDRLRVVWAACAERSTSET